MSKAARRGRVRRLTAHTAAVKALAWCPFQSNLLASGGGTADRCIKFWNAHTGALVNSIDTHSQARCRTASLALCPVLSLLHASQACLRVSCVAISTVMPWVSCPEHQCITLGICAGLRAAVEPAREGDPEQPRLQPEPALPVEVPIDGQGEMHPLHATLPALPRPCCRAPL
jgi:hypothetical protein